MKINWKDPKFKGLTKRQIKDYMALVSKGQSPKLPKPKPSKRVNKKIQKHNFMEALKAPKAAHQSRKNGPKVNIPTTFQESTKKLATLQKAANASKVIIDVTFDSKHTKPVRSEAACFPHQRAGHNQFISGQN